MRDIIRSEWSKAISTRASRCTVPIAVAVSIGMTLLITWSFENYRGSQELSGMDYRAMALMSLTVGQLVLIVFAVQLIGSEFSTGSIRTSLVAVPNRSRWYLGKLIVGMGTTLVLAAVTVLASFYASQLILGEHGVSISQAQLPQAMLGACVYLMLLCGFAIGLAAILRSSVATLVILLPLLFLDSQGLGNLPHIKDYMQYLPSEAGLTMFRMVPATGRFSHDYDHWGALALMVAWFLAAVVGGYLVTRKREV